MDTEIPQLTETFAQHIERVVVGGAPLAEVLLLALAAGGHALLEGPPGTGKTLLGRAVSRLVGLPFRRVQLTPDLLPADITGTMVMAPGQGGPSFRPGPVFTGVLMADEVNRAPPRTQAALLEAMEERQVTVDGVSRPLDPHFTVIATLNTVEVDGAWPLPEAQLDRFAVHVRMGYPSAAVEAELLERMERGLDPRGAALAALEPLLDTRLLDELAGACRSARIAPVVQRFLLELVQATRADPRVALGPSPRAVVQLASLCRARAALAGRDHVLPDDVASLLHPALAHRVRLHPEALLDEEDAAGVLDSAREQVEVPR